MDWCGKRGRKGGERKGVKGWKGGRGGGYMGCNIEGNSIVGVSCHNIPAWQLAEK